jgi:hypothetical protein
MTTIKRFHHVKLPCCQHLIALLTEDPPCRMPRSAPGWASRPAASGRPAAAVLTDKLRRHPAIAALINADADTARREMHGQAAVQ